MPTRIRMRRKTTKSNNHSFGGAPGVAARLDGLSGPSLHGIGFYAFRPQIRYVDIDPKADVLGQVPIDRSGSS